MTILDELSNLLKPPPARTPRLTPADGPAVLIDQDDEPMQPGPIGAPRGHERRGEDHPEEQELPVESGLPMRHPVLEVITRTREDVPGDFIPSTVNVDNVWRRLVGRDNDRRAVELNNTGGATIYLSNTPDARIGLNTNTIAPGQTRTMTTTSDIWFAVAAGNGTLEVTLYLDSKVL